MLNIFDSFESFIMMILLAVAVTLIVTFILAVTVVPDQKRDKLKGFARTLNNIFNFRGLLIEAIVKFLYVLVTVMFVVGGFFLLFVTDPYSDDWYGWIGIIVMVVGPIFTRLIFESAMLMILLVKNIIQINNKLKDQTRGDAVPVFQVNVSRPAEPTYAPTVKTADKAPAVSAEPKATEASEAPQTPVVSPKDEEKNGEKPEDNAQA